eukprot:scaffold170_cov281-Pinguiococcus_pyrenoidosus.AAC.15
MKRAGLNPPSLCAGWAASSSLSTRSTISGSFVAVSAPSTSSASVLVRVLASMAVFGCFGRSICFETGSKKQTAGKGLLQIALGGKSDATTSTIQ